METHKPKSWRGPGEFLRECLIIVVGVLIALGGEQAVEWMHHQTELAETREALREEIGQNLAFATFGAAIDRCRAGILEKYMDWAHGSSPRPENPPVGIPDLNFGVWDVAKAGPLSRMPVKERLSFALVYDDFAKQQKYLDRQSELAVALVQYTNRKQLDLSPDQAQRVLELSTAIETVFGVKDRFLPTLLNDVHALGISPEPISAAKREGLNGLCQAGGVPVPAL